MAGMYLRGLVLDYRVGWESTFLDAGTVQPLLSTLLAPASALSGIAVPDVAGCRRCACPPAPRRHGVGRAVDPPVCAATGCCWWCCRGWRWRCGPACARARLQRRLCPCRWTSPTSSACCGSSAAARTPVRVWPHARTPDAAALAALKSAVRRGSSARALRWQVAPTVAYGAEDEPAQTPADGALRIALFDLGATPEAESQGRLLRALAAPGARRR